MVLDHDPPFGLGFVPVKVDFSMHGTTMLGEGQISTSSHSI